MYTAIIVVFGFVYFYQVQSSGLAERIRVLEQQLKKEEEDKKFRFIQQHKNGSEHRSSAVPSGNSQHGRGLIDSHISRRLIDQADARRDNAINAGNQRRSRKSDRSHRMDNVLNPPDAAVRDIAQRNSQYRHSGVSWT